MSELSSYFLFILTENDDCEMTVSEKSRMNVVMDGRSLFDFRNNEDERTGR